MTTIKHPYQNLTNGKWIKGNLHAHTTSSDGERPHQAVIDDYASRGHGFLMISDHDIFISADDYLKFDNQGLVLIPGNEVTANGPHMQHIGASSLVAPDADRQKVIDDIAEDTGFAIFNHPNWQSQFSHCPQELLERCQGYIGLEIYNGVISRLGGSPYATNRWDMLLSQGRRLWGFANDDSHKAVGDVGLGWNTVYVQKETVDDVVNSLREGRFYTSTGVEISRIQVDSLRITIETENASRVVALRNDAVRFAQVDDHSISVDVPPDASYVRFECWGIGESFAWTQPFFIET